MSLKSSEFLAEPPKQLETPQNPIIDSSTFTDFLFKDYPESRQFAPEITLPWISDVVDYLSTERQIVDKNSGRLKELLEKHNVPEHIRKGYGERMIFLYYDYEAQETRYSPIQHGDYASVSMQSEFVDDNTTLLMEFHTHPRQSLFSPQDYASLVLKIGDLTERALSASVLVCPGCQILALASPETPRMSEEEFNAFVEDLNNSPDSDPHLQELQQKVFALNDNLKDTLVDATRKVNEDFDEKELSEEELTQELFQEMRDQFEELTAEAKELSLSASREFSDYAELLTNSVTLQAARDLNIVLYISADKCHFKRFE